MKIENFAGAVLPDEFLEKVSGGVTTEFENEDWMVFYLNPNESCIGVRCRSNIL